MSTAGPPMKGNPGGGEHSSQPGAGGAAPAGGAIFLFNTTHDVLRAEEAVIDAGFWCDVVPRPPDALAGLCGLALEVEAGDAGAVSSLLDAEGVAFEIYGAAA